VLGDAFATLDAKVQHAHLPPLVAHGLLDVEHGSHWLTPLLIRVLKLPAAGRAQAVRLEVMPTGDRVIWMRQIGGTVLRTVQHARGDHIIEEHGLGRIAFALRVDRGSLDYRHYSMSVARVPVPHFIQPRIRARVSGLNEGWYVEVVVTWRTHLVCRYCGAMNAR
jgi:hypothetical protein